MSVPGESTLDFQTKSLLVLLDVWLFVLVRFLFSREGTAVTVSSLFSSLADRSIFPGVELFVSTLFSCFS